MQKPGLFGMNGFMVFLFSCLVLFSRAQSGTLILIDADNRQPFHVRIGEQLYSSSSQGHLVISHLKDSVYRLNFRFPKKNITEQVFPVAIRQKDLGFQLRRADSAWILYNWQTKETIKAVKETDSSNILDLGVKREDGFSKLMAYVVNDTAVLYDTYAGSWLTGTDSQQVAKKIKPAKDSAALVVNSSKNNAAGPSTKGKTKNNAGGVAVVVPAAKKTDSAQNVAKTTTAKQTTTAAPPPVTPTVAAAKDSVNNPPTATAAKPVSKVKKLREVSLKISRKMVFLDIGPAGGPDTVTIFVYFETPEAKTVAAAAAPAGKDKTDSMKAGTATVRNAPATDSSKINTVQKTTALAKPAAVKNAPDSTKASTTAKTSAKPTGKKVAGDTMMKKGQKPVETVCSQLASDADLESVRDAILKGNTESEKMAAASAGFAQKCYSVSQVRVLAGLFVSDKAKFKLMEASRFHISDADHYKELVDMLSDRNFQRKFLAMAEKHS